MKLPDFAVDLPSLFSIEGKRVLVTGGSAGIGRMIAEGCLLAGASVIICGRNEHLLQATTAELRAHGDCRCFAADVTQAASVTKLGESVAEQYGALDILVNNAGGTANEPIDRYTRDIFASVIDLNLTSVFDVTRTMLPLLRAAATPQSPARILNVSSIAAHRIREGSTAYAYNASKAGLAMLTRHLAQALAAEWINVNAIAPGLFPSRMSAPVFSDDEAERTAGSPTGEFRIPLGRAGAPEDVIAATLYLCSRAGSYLTGVTIPLTGGVGTTD